MAIQQADVLQGEIQQILVDEALNCIDGLIKKAKIVIDGNILITDIYHTPRKSGIIRKYVYLDSEEGLITRVSLINEQGAELYTKEPNYQKTAQLGYVTAFPIQLRVEAVDK